MRIREVEKHHWKEFCDGFSGLHEGWIASLRVRSDGSEEPVATDLPFVGVTLDPERDSISLAIGEDPREHLTHIVEHPKKVWVEQTEEGADSALGIESEAGDRIVLSFRTTTLPEFLDGIASP
ncbi:MAG: DUF5335 family protein [Anaerolineae bacterium]